MVGKKGGRAVADILKSGSNLPFSTSSIHGSSRPAGQSRHPALRQDLSGDAEALPVAEPVQPGARHSGRAHECRYRDGQSSYTRAAKHLDDWIASGVLARDSEPGIFPYFQEFTVPDTGERLVRKGFIALGKIEEYSASVVHRHEQTLSGPKKDRLELLRHTHAHFGQLFMLYPDPDSAIDALLDEAAQSAPLAEITDEYGAAHRIWKITDAARIQQLMSDKKLLIADGHHRYETALAFRNENPNLPGADRVMMTFVNMHSPGLKILATHRLVNGIPTAGFPDEFLRAAAEDFQVQEIDSLDKLKSRMGRPVPNEASSERRSATVSSCWKNAMRATSWMF